MSNTPPTYEDSNLDNSKIISEVNKKTFKKLREILDRIDDIDKNGVSDAHNNYIRQIMKAFDNRYLYEGFSDDYEYVLEKLSLKITTNNNFSLRSICEALERK